MNVVKLAGRIDKIQTYPERDGKQAYARVTLVVQNERGNNDFFYCRAYGAACDTLEGFEQGDAVEVVGRLGKAKNMQEQWDTVVVIAEASQGKDSKRFPGPKIPI